MTLFRRTASLLLPAFTLVVFFFAAGIYIAWSEQLSQPQQKEAALGTIVMVATFLLAVLLLVAWWVYHKLSAPLYNLEKEALRLSAGDYNQPIQVEGPREIQGLANAYNVLQASIEDHLLRLHESKVARELLYGEQECAFFLQHHMLDDVVENTDSSLVDMRSLSVHFGTQPWGLLVEVEEKDACLHLQLTEASSAGFDGIFQLLYHAKSSEHAFPRLRITLNPSTKKIEIERRDMPAPLIWSAQEEQFVSSLSTSYQYSEGDYLFLSNKGVAELVQRGELVPDWFQKVLRHFAEEGLVNVATMLQRELQFIAKSSHAVHDLHMLCVRIR